jgi:hypothetical protein
MPYSPATPNYSYNTPIPYDVPQVEPSEHYAQAQQKTAYHNAQKAYEQQTFSNHSVGLGSLVDAQVKTKQYASLEKAGEVAGLRDESGEVRKMAETSLRLLNDLKDLLFESVPECGEVGCPNTAQVPTLEGNILSTKYMLKDHVRELERTISKIGGR